MKNIVQERFLDEIVVEGARSGGSGSGFNGDDSRPGNQRGRSLRASSSDENAWIIRRLRKQFDL